MAETSANRVDRVFPRVPVRQDRPERVQPRRRHSPAPPNQPETHPLHREAEAPGSMCARTRSLKSSWPAMSLATRLPEPEIPLVFAPTSPEDPRRRDYSWGSGWFTCSPIIESWDEKTV